MNKGLMFDPSVYREKIKELNKGKFKREQSKEIQSEKIALAQQKKRQKSIRKG